MFYMHKPEQVIDNKGLKILCNFETQTDQPIPARRPELALINREKK